MAHQKNFIKFVSDNDKSDKRFTNVCENSGSDSNILGKLGKVLLRYNSEQIMEKQQKKHRKKGKKAAAK